MEGGCMGVKCWTLVLLAMSFAWNLNAESRKSKLWRWSAAALASATTVDTISTVGLNEANPVLGTGRFGARAFSIKSGIVVGAVIAQTLVLKRTPQYQRNLAFANFAMAGLTTGVAIRNFRLK
jgi:hypothetical protein